MCGKRGHIHTGTGDGVAGRDDVHLALHMAKAEELSRDNGHNVLFVVDPREVRHLQIHKCTSAHQVKWRRTKGMLTVASKKSA